MENSNKDIKEIRVSELTVFTVEETKNSLDEFLAKDEKVKLIFENVSAIDLSYIQLLYSLKNAQNKDKVIFDFEDSITPEIEELLINTGFSEITE